MKNKHDDIEKILLSEEELDRITTELGQKISSDYENSGRKLLLLGILKGSIVFLADLMRKISLPTEIEFMKVSSYGSSTTSSGHLNITLDLRHHDDLSDVDVLIVEDIIDSGRTLSFLCDYLRQRGAASVKCVTMLDKPSRREVIFSPDYAGKVIPNLFVVGYGLDYAQKYRDLPYIGILKEEIYTT